MCTVYNIADININSFQIKNPETLVIIVSHVYEFNYLNITIQFIKKFPKGKNHVVLITTCEGLKLWKLSIPSISDISFLLASIILKIVRI